MDSSLGKNIHSVTFVISKAKCRRGVSPIIATLLLVAIATVGGSTVFAFSQDAFNTSQISGSPQVELIKIFGYDGRDVEKLNLHDGNEIEANNCCGVADGKKSFDERIAIYIQNNSAQPIVISELRFGGNVYSFAPASKIGEWDKIVPGHRPHPNEYIIVNYHKGGNAYDTVKTSPPEIQAGGIVTLLLDLGGGIGMNHDSQVKITTIKGNIFISTILIGQEST